MIRNPHVRSDMDGNPVAKAIKQSRAAYAGGQLEAGAVLNLSDADLESLSKEERDRYQETIDAFPALTERDVYVGVESDVEEHNGRMVLGPNAELRVGDSRYSISTAAKRLGMSEDELRDAIEDELAQMAVELPIADAHPIDAASNSDSASASASCAAAVGTPSFVDAVRIRRGECVARSPSPSS